MKSSRKPFYVSVNTIKNFLTCPRYYYWKTIRRLEFEQFNAPFMTGRLTHFGVQHMLEKKPKWIAAMKKEWSREKRIIRVRFPELSATDEQKLEIQRPAVFGMLAGFKRMYSIFLRESSAKSEVPFELPIGKNIIVAGKLDNLIRNKKYDWLYELKTAKYISMEYVRNLSVDFQTSVYHHAIKSLKLVKKLKGIIYHVIQKPTIRQKQKETIGEYMNRVSDWYTTTESDRKYFFERVLKPKLSPDQVTNTIIRVVDICKSNGFEKEKFYENFQACIRDWGRCEMFDLCHNGGETKENMAKYRIRERYRVKK